MITKNRIRNSLVYHYTRSKSAKDFIDKLYDSPNKKLKIVSSVHLSHDDRSLDFSDLQLIEEKDYNE